MTRRALGFACITSLLAAVWAFTPTSRSSPSRRGEILANDNRRPAGELRDGVLSVDLVAGAGAWFPEEDDGPAHEVYAFGEAGHRLTNPGPLLRVPAGTEIRARIINSLGHAPLVVHGLHDRPGSPAAVTVAAGDTASVRFRADLPGTYYYWATTRGVRALRDRFGPESQLVGALIVDPPGPVPADHVFVIGIEDDSADIPAARKLYAAVVNGRSWPHSHMSTVRTGDTVRMRWINTSDRGHPMHLHGFYFNVNSRGEGARDTIYGESDRRLAVTELLLPGQTVSLDWVPDRPGNWLMHCHMAVHVSPELRGRPRHAADAHAVNHTLDVMAGLVTGWRVVAAEGSVAEAEAAASAPEAGTRALRLRVRSAPGRYGADPGLGFTLETDASAGRVDSVTIPGPPIVLTRGQPVRITVANELDEPTSIHWHGIELDSYFDGVSGWSGSGRSVTPAVAARDSFVVRFTPPRAGTFIYHSHFEETRQLSSGMYGPLIVLEPGVRYDPDTDLSWVLSQGGPVESVRAMLNGSRSPVIDLEARRSYRIRLININPNVPLTFSVSADSVPVAWLPIAKDGATLPPSQSRAGPAVVRIGVGETYDFALAPEPVGDLQIRALDPGGVTVLSGVIHVRAGRR